MKEKQRRTASGFAYLIALILALFGAVWELIGAVNAVKNEQGSPYFVLGWLCTIPILLICLKGLFGVQPNQGMVLQLFGHYVGTERTPGLRWSQPTFYSKKTSVPADPQLRNGPPQGKR